jgi:hypothetical protein
MNAFCVPTGMTLWFILLTCMLEHLCIPEHILYPALSWHIIFMIFVLLD